MRFAKRGLDLRFARIDASAWKSDLSSVGAQMLAADRQDDARYRSIGDGDKNGSSHFRIAAKLRGVASQRRIDCLDRKRVQKSAPKPGSSGHFEVSRGKKVPLLHTPGVSLDVAIASSASS
jgi:hypothetical protein